MVSFRSCSGTTKSRFAAPTLLTLPHELVHKIVSHVVYAPGLFPDSAFISAKPRWAATIAGFASASRETRVVALRAWFRVLVLKEEEDWEVANSLSYISLFVRELYVHSTALSPITSPDALLAFPTLRSVHINAHNDVAFDPRTGYTYYTLLPHVPKGLKRLAIAHSHAPDGERLEALARIGGGEIEELRLGRCTLFDCATQGCSYWPAFPHDHDAYFSDEGAVEYAASIAQDLVPLKNLRAIHLGVYLTPHVALSTHQHHHTSIPASDLEPSNLPVPPNHGTLLHPPPAHHLHLLQHPHHRAPLHSPSLWASPCEACLTQFGPATQLAEHAACTALGTLVPRLKQISWAGYFEPYGRGVSEWYRACARGKEDWVWAQN